MTLSPSLVAFEEGRNAFLAGVDDIPPSAFPSVSALKDGDVEHGVHPLSASMIPPIEELKRQWRFGWLEAEKETRVHR